MSALTMTGKTSPTVATRRRRPIDYPGLALWITLVVTSLLWAAPFLLMFLTSVKTNADINQNPAWDCPRCGTGATTPRRSTWATSVSPG